jgi:predicted negative regulator of RcsB-dependent stress response
VAQQVSRTHISRKELKKDEFRDSFVHGAEAVRSHQQSFAIVIGVVLLLAVGILGWRIYSQRKTTQASAALDDAMKTYQARIRTAAEPVTDPNEVTYTDEKNKYSDAAKKFDGIVASFGRTKPGLEARYYAAICYEQLGKYDVAEQDLNAVENSGDTDLASLAKFQHAGLYATTGKTQPAIDLYNQLMRNDPSALVPKPIVMLSLAELYGHTNPPEAKNLLNQIKVEYPNTPAAEAAQKRLELPPAPPQS